MNKLISALKIVSGAPREFTLLKGEWSNSGFFKEDWETIGTFKTTAQEETTRLEKEVDSWLKKKYGPGIKSIWQDVGLTLVVLPDEEQFDVFVVATDELAVLN